MSQIMEDLIALQKCNENLDKINNDPSYIQKKADEIFGNKKYVAEKVMEDIRNIIAEA